MNPYDPLSNLAARLIRRAAAKTPASLSERLQEEWLADMAVRRGSISRLRFALGCCWAAQAIAHELGVPVRVAAAAGKSAVAVVHRGAGYRSRGTTIFMFIVGGHVLLIYGLETGLVRRVFEKAPDPFAVTTVAEHPQERPPPPPLSAPTFKPTRVEDSLIPWPKDPTPTGITISEPPPPVIPGRPPLRPMQRVTGGPGQGFPATDDYYPEAARRLEEKGHATVQVCVDASGRLTADPRLTESSGSPRLDQGALRLAKAGSGHYRPTTEDGRPVSSCYAFGIRFQLKD